MNARNILLILLSFLGIGAIFGGTMFIVSPSGDLFKMPLSFLDGSPFSNFLVPGIVLFTVLGVMPLILVWALIRRPKSTLAERLNFYTDMHWAWSYSVYIAFALIIWIQVEMIVLRTVHWFQTFYMGLALAILSIALLPQVRNLYKRWADF